MYAYARVLQIPMKSFISLSGYSRLCLTLQCSILMVVACLCVPINPFAQTKTTIDLNTILSAPPELTVLAHDLRVESLLQTRHEYVFQRLVRMVALKVKNNS